MLQSDFVAPLAVTSLVELHKGHSNKTNGFGVRAGQEACSGFTKTHLFHHVAFWHSSPESMKALVGEIVQNIAMTNKTGTVIKHLQNYALVYKKLYQRNISIYTCGKLCARVKIISSSSLRWKKYFRSI